MRRRKRRAGKRNRERRSKRVVCRAEWWFSGRLAVVVEVDSRGVVWPVVRGNPSRVSPGDRERAADYLREYLPRMGHESRYEILWGG